MARKTDSEKYHVWRHRIFKSYQSMGLDATLDLLKGSKLSKNAKKGLHGELLFYDEYKDSKKLEPSLDAGTKTDFYGIDDKKPMHYDVTTNLHYKNPNAYLPLRKKGLDYTIVLVEDLKKRKFEFFPLKFPICSDCGQTAHYILYLVPSTSEIYRNLPLTDDQRILIYCPCGYNKELEDFNYVVDSPLELAGEISANQYEEELRDPNFNFKKIIQQESISLVQFFEKESQRLISALVENEYQITDRDGDGFWEGRICWKHPLAKNLDDTIDLYYGNWGV